MGDQEQYKPLTREELEALAGEPLPERAAMSLINANIAAPINAALALNVLSDGSIAYANDPELREVFRQTIRNWPELNFSKIDEAKARKAHPKIMSWLGSENKAWVRREFGDLLADKPSRLEG